VIRSVHLAARQAVLEQRSFWRSAEYALLTFALPLMLLLLLLLGGTSGGYFPDTRIRIIMFFVPGMLAFGVIVAAYVNLGAKVAVPRPAGLLALAAGLVAGIGCFAALGLAISSVIRSAESAGPVANASYLPVAIVSGLFDPTLGLPRWLSLLVGALPVKALADLLQDGYTVHAFPVVALLILLAWAAAGTAFAVWRFRWHG
jgi:ABC-2 type transporter